MKPKLVFSKEIPNTFSFEFGKLYIHGNNNLNEIQAGIFPLTYHKVSGQKLCDEDNFEKMCDDCKRDDQNNCKSKKRFHHFSVTLHYGEGSAITICNYNGWRFLFISHGLGGGEGE